MVRKQVLGVDVLSVKEDELAVARMPRATFNDEGMVALGRRQVRDVGELTEADREESLVRLHVKGFFASLLRPCRVSQQHTADEDVENAASVPVAVAIKPAV